MKLRYQLRHAVERVLTWLRYWALLLGMPCQPTVTGLNDAKQTASTRKDGTASLTPNSLLLILACIFTVKAG